MISSARAPLPDDSLSSTGAEPLVTVQDAAREDELTRVLRSHLRVRPGASIVEVGCGTGELAAWFARFEPNAKVVGVDASVAMLRRAAERAEHGRLRQLSFLLGNVNHLPLEDGSADLVVCKHLLCVLYDLDRALEEMTRVVKPGGVLVAIEPASAHLFHDPEDSEFAALSQRLNQAFYHGWRRRGVDQRIGLKVPGIFLRNGLEQIRVEVISRVHLLGDVLRSADEVREQLETESYGLPESTIKLVLDGGMSRRELQEHNRSTRERLRRFLGDPGQAARSGYTRLAPAVIVTIGRKARPT